MEITEVKIFLNERSSGNDIVKAYVHFCLKDKDDDLCFKIDGAKIIEVPGGKLFVSMPAKKNEKAKAMGGCPYRDIISPINQKTRTIMETIILAAYRAEVERAKDRLQKAY